MTYHLTAAQEVREQFADLVMHECCIFCKCMHFAPLVCRIRYRLLHHFVPSVIHLLRPPPRPSSAVAPSPPLSPARHHDGARRLWWRRRRGRGRSRAVWPARLARANFRNGVRRPRRRQPSPSASCCGGRGLPSGRVICDAGSRVARPPSHLRQRASPPLMQLHPLARPPPRAATLAAPSV